MEVTVDAMNGIERAVAAGVVLLFGCSTAPTPETNPDTVRRHADKAFQQLKAQEAPQQAQADNQSASSVPISGEAVQPSPRKTVEIPASEIGPADGEYIWATGYGNLAKGLFLCQHSADLAARVELSKLVRVQVKEKSVDRIREKTGKDAEQDIEVVREALVDEVLTDVRIVDRKVNQEAGTCASTAMIPRRNLFPTSNADTRISSPR
ncbi:MAG TPA: hypothetical protein VJ746_17540 [Nitrospira sp.]|nr:hypothetical protein [Nitrospira sp.]